MNQGYIPQADDISPEEARQMLAEMDAQDERRAWRSVPMAASTDGQCASPLLM